MKIIYFANIRIPTEKAHGAQIFKTCEAFVKARGSTRMGKQIDTDTNSVNLLISTRRNLQFAGVDPFEYYGVGKVFGVKKLYTPDPVWLMKLPQGAYIKFQTLFFLVSLFLFLIHKKNQSADFFYTRDEILLPLLLKFSKKVIWEAHNLPRRRKCYVKYWQCCHKIIAISQGLKDELVKMRVAGEKILVAADGVDIEKFSIFNFSARGGSALGGKFQISNVKLRQELDLPIDKKIIMYTGHLYDWKGAGVLLKVARNYCSFFKLASVAPTTTHPFTPPQEGIGRNSPLERGLKGCVSKDLIEDEILFVFVGGTESDVRKFRAEAQGLENVLIVGHRPPDEIPSWLKCADVLVLPNSAKKEISKQFTSPLKMFEYMAATKPIVASDLPSIREVLNNNNAVLVTPDDPESLANGINQVLQDEDLARKISQQAFDDVQNYSWQKRGQKIFEFIK